MFTLLYGTILLKNKIKSKNASTVTHRHLYTKKEKKEYNVNKRTIFLAERIGEESGLFKVHDALTLLNYFPVSAIIFRANKKECYYDFFFVTHTQCFAK